MRQTCSDFAERAFAESCGPKSSSWAAPTWLRRLVGVFGLALAANGCGQADVPYGGDDAALLERKILNAQPDRVWEARNSGVGPVYDEALRQYILHLPNQATATSELFVVDGGTGQLLTWGYVSIQLETSPGFKPFFPSLRTTEAPELRYRVENWDGSTDMILLPPAAPLGNRPAVNLEDLWTFNHSGALADGRSFGVTLRNGRLLPPAGLPSY